MADHFDEPLPVFNGFHIGRNYFNFGVLAEKCDHIGFSDVQLVTQAGKMGEADPLLGDQVNHTPADRARLRYKPDGPFGRDTFDKGGIEPGVQVQGADAIGSDQPHPVALGNLEAFLFQFNAGPAHFFEPT